MYVHLLQVRVDEKRVLVEVDFAAVVLALEDAQGCRYDVGLLTAPGLFSPTLSIWTAQRTGGVTGGPHAIVFSGVARAAIPVYDRIFWKVPPLRSCIRLCGTRASGLNNDEFGRLCHRLKGGNGHAHPRACSCTWSLAAVLRVLLLRYGGGQGAAFPCDY